LGGHEARRVKESLMPKRGIKDWIRSYRDGGISRREFVERASAAGLGLLATEAALASVDGKKIPSHSHDHNHGHEPQKHDNPDQTNLNPYVEWRKGEGIPIHTDYSIANLRAV